MENLERERAIESFADDLMAQCTSLVRAREINTEYDLFDGDLLPQLMQGIACWNGTYDIAVSQMIKNILRAALNEIAEREVTK